jgi:hypothetical protein
MFFKVGTRESRNEEVVTRCYVGALSFVDLDPVGPWCRPERDCKNSKIHYQSCRKPQLSSVPHRGCRRLARVREGLVKFWTEILTKISFLSSFPEREVLLRRVASTTVRTRKFTTVLPKAGKVLRSTRGVSKGDRKF